MLKLKDIKKTYVLSSDMQVHALKGINLCFRKNEFVSILGPSGCGKTTLLNIIGGLDKYSSGDLVINGKSTKEFNDRDWDIYRNHRIGFIFQSYNLIPHQTILGNVELALTISGVSKQERIEKAKKALDRVGLKDQYNKHPNQLSGGQCQRVAIARALVNEPEILLADEPTGALDTETSVQIMELIKEIAAEKLVIMVTHNPELAHQYSTRIVNLLDGELKADSNPFSEEDEALEIEAINKAEEEKAALELASIDTTDEKAVKKYNKNKNSREKAKMSFWTAFKLSARNLYSKIRRSIMVVIAGSIGIIGVSAVLAVSQGVKDYIVNIQDDLLSGNPVKIQKSGIDYETLMNSSSFQTQIGAVKVATDKGTISVNSLVKYLVQNQKALESLAFQNEFDSDYVSYILSMPEDYYNTISLRYGMSVDYNVYTDYKVSNDVNDPNYNLKKQYDKNISIDSINQTYANTITNILSAANVEESKVDTYSSLITALTKPLSQSVDFDKSSYIKEQYDLVAGTYPTEKTGNQRDIMIVLDSEGKITDLILAQLGYYSQEEFFDTIYSSINESNKDIEGTVPIKIDNREFHAKEKFTYEELLGKKFTWYPNDTVFTKSGSTFKYSYVAPTDKTNTMDLNVVGVLKLKEGTSYGALSSGFLYSEGTAREMIRRNIDSEINQYIRDKINANGGNESTSSITSTFTYDLKCYWESIDQATGEIHPFDNKTNEDRDTYTVGIGQTDSTSNLTSFFMAGSTTYNDSISKIEDIMKYLPLMVKDEYKELVQSYLEDMSKMMSLDSSKKLYVKTFGGTYLPNQINIYPTNFEIKDKVVEYLKAWNSIEGKDAVEVTFNTYNDDFTKITGTKTLAPADRKEIKYTDSVGIIINLINTMIDIVTYALVAFTALSLIVSTVMIAIITYVSVMERVKEIGVIRSLGGRKKDVSHLFNAEAFIIGIVSGVFGVIITYIIQLVANIAIKIVSKGVVNTIANFTPLTALIMILVSILLTSISGLIPARSAARKDPVVALRTE